MQRLPQISEWLAGNGLAASPRIGCVTQVRDNGEILVEWPGLESSVVALVLNPNQSDYVAGDTVLIVQTGDSTPLPVVVGLVGTRLPKNTDVQLEKVLRLEVGDVASVPTANHDVEIDGRSVTLSAGDELVLRCGKGSITIRKNGKILVKGTELVTHASGTNRIKGGTVSIN